MYAVVASVLAFVLSRVLTPRSARLLVPKAIHWERLSAASSVKNSWNIVIFWVFDFKVPRKRYVEQMRRFLVYMLTANNRIPHRTYRPRRLWDVRSSAWELHSILRYACGMTNYDGNNLFLVVGDLNRDIRAITLRLHPIESSRRRRRPAKKAGLFFAFHSDRRLWFAKLSYKQLISTRWSSVFQRQSDNIRLNPKKAKKPVSKKALTTWEGGRELHSILEVTNYHRSSLFLAVRAGTIQH